MARKVLAVVGLILTLVAVYLLVWPVPVAPVAWQAPVAPDYVGPFAQNDRLKAIEMLPIADNHGPETIALDAEGRIYVTTHEGRIVRLRADGSNPENWVTTGGRPLGIRFDTAGNLPVADGLRMLMPLAPYRTTTVLATEADGKPILFANSVDVAADGPPRWRTAAEERDSQGPMIPRCLYRLCVRRRPAQEPHRFMVGYVRST